MNIKIVVDRFEGEKAILKTETKESIIWPKDKLPKSTLEGMVLNFSINNDKDSTTEKEDLAKDILNEILNTD